MSYISITAYSSSCSMAEIGPALRGLWEFDFLSTVLKRQEVHRLKIGGLWTTHSLSQPLQLVYHCCALKGQPPSDRRQQTETNKEWEKEREEPLHEHISRLAFCTCLLGGISSLRGSTFCLSPLFLSTSSGVLNEAFEDLRERDKTTCSSRHHFCERFSAGTFK